MKDRESMNQDDQPGDAFYRAAAHEAKAQAVAGLDAWVARNHAVCRQVGPERLERLYAKLERRQGADPEIRAERAA